MKPKVLFLCTGNSARSQMAEGFLRHFAGEDFEALSAGTNPGRLNPLAVQAMAELGIDISRQFSKNVTQFLGAPIQHVVTVCDNARETCPVFPGAARFLHWSFPDPAAAQGTQEEKLAVFREIRDQIETRIKQEFCKIGATQKA
ncbi:MAG TPA: arsenate reductase ArsC [Terriglobales bacterium]|nr:arsenate reductase ArsC [Terriglobales bacterium]